MNDIEGKVMEQDIAIKKLEELFSKDHDETIKQRHQIDELYKKLGNGWSSKIELGIDDLVRRVNELEKTDIRIYEKLNRIDSNIDELKNRPRNKMLAVKDAVYIIMACTGILGFVMSMGIL